VGKVGHSGVNVFMARSAFADRFDDNAIIMRKGRRCGSRRNGLDGERGYVSGKFELLRIDKRCAICG